MKSPCGKEFNNIMEALADAENACPQTTLEYKKCKIKISAGRLVTMNIH